jgi:hypothetical protein
MNDAITDDPIEYSLFAYNFVMAKSDSSRVPKEYAAFQALLRKVVKPEPKPSASAPALPSQKV